MSVERIIETNGWSSSVLPGTLYRGDLVSEGTVAQEMAAGSGSCYRAGLGAPNQLLLVP